MHSARISRQGQRGFTLLELLVSLTAGLIIAISVAGLSKVATTTFYEESRVQVAELSLRVAVERLRADLGRAAYMATPNILKDPMVVLPQGQTMFSAPSNLSGGLGRLAGVRYFPNDVLPDDDNNGAIIALTEQNLGAGVRPDRLILAGNFTTADEYIVQSITTGGTCGGQELTLSTNSPAIGRLVRDASGTPLKDEDAQIVLTEAFRPSSAANATFLVRIVDDSGKRQFVQLCGSNPVRFSTTDGPRLSISPDTPILNANDSGAQGGTTGFGVGRLTVNPVQMVEWSVRARNRAGVVTPSWAQDTSADADTQFDLVREMLDASGRRIGRPEVVAEFVVDFEIGLVVENPTTRLMQIAPFDTPADPLIVAHAEADPAATLSTQGPQWIRSLRYRIATRAPIADRENNLERPPGVGYAYRYCVQQAAAAECTRYARMRTLTGEISLPNQARWQ